MLKHPPHKRWVIFNQAKFREWLPSAWQQKRTESGWLSPTTGESGADRIRDLQVVPQQMRGAEQWRNAQQVVAMALCCKLITNCSLYQQKPTLNWKGKDDRCQKSDNQSCCALGKWHPGRLHELSDRLVKWNTIKTHTSTHQFLRRGDSGCQFPLGNQGNAGESMSMQYPSFQVFDPIKTS